MMLRECQSPKHRHFDEVQEEAEEHGRCEDRDSDGDGNRLHFDPRRASTEMIMMSATVATIIHVLGSDLQRCRRSRTQ